MSMTRPLCVLSIMFRAEILFDLLTVNRPSLCFSLGWPRRHQEEAQPTSGLLEDGFLLTEGETDLAAAGVGVVEKAELGTATTPRRSGSANGSRDRAASGVKVPGG